jgi:hypothetical protein
MFFVAKYGSSNCILHCQYDVTAILSKEHSQFLNLLKGVIIHGTLNLHIHAVGLDNGFSVASISPKLIRLLFLLLPGPYQSIKSSVI